MIKKSLNDRFIALFIKVIVFLTIFTISCGENAFAELGFYQQLILNPSPAGGNVLLRFWIINPDPTPVTDISFTDDLDAFIPGLVATGLPVADVLGTGSSLSGTSLITLTGGSIIAGAADRPAYGYLDVILQIPAIAQPGTYTNTTSELFVSGIPESSPAHGILAIVPGPAPAPIFTKSFTPDTITAGAISTLTFTIDNSESAITFNSLKFTDNLPAGVEVANPSNAFTTFTGGTLTAVSGNDVISYTDGTIEAGSICTISVDVTANTSGLFVNTTGDLTYLIGNSGTASDTLSVNQEPIAVPTLSDWGKIIFIILIGFTSIVYLKKKRNIFA